MEARRITIVHTKNQKKSVILSSATTLGELKDDLRTNGIDYNDMTFYEGLSKTELKTDESLLPHDIERNGQVTNELVFMLTNTDKKIKSGSMSRPDAYNYIKKHKLQDVVVNMFGKNFTMCKTADLISVVENHKKKDNKVKETPKETPKETVEQKVKEEVKEEVTTKECNCSCKCNNDIAVAAIRKLVEILYRDERLDESDVEDITNILGGEIPNTSTTFNEDNLSSPYSQDEINQMFRGMK